MDKNVIIGTALILFGHMISAFSQILMKTAAKKTYSVWWKSYLNPLVIIAYAMLISTTVITVIALRFIPLSFSAALGAAGQIFVGIFSYIFLHEEISKQKKIGMALIVLGIVIFSL